MGKVVRSMDWSKTPLGPLELWPQSLRTTVSFWPASEFSKLGDRSTCRFITMATGRSAAESIRTPWDRISASAGLRRGRSSGKRLSARLQVRRLTSKTRECFSTAMATSKKRFSPFRSARSVTSRDEVGGLFYPVTETTAERRLRGLRDLLARGGKGKNERGSVNAIGAKHCRSSSWMFPFAMFYLLDIAGKEARLVAGTATPEPNVA